MKKIILLVTLACLGGGCASVSYSPYVGEQQAWQTAPGAFVKEMRGIVIYRGYPSRAYQVLGQLSISSSPEAVESYLAKEALKRNAEAVIILESKTELTGFYTTPSGPTLMDPRSRVLYQASGPSFAVPVHEGSITAMLIRFKDKQP
ncbi:MAG: hypothetical protein WCO56_21345 [Verrucomicrobiota bacterium]